jgi:hypothetical protein
LDTTILVENNSNSDESDYNIELIIIPIIAAIAVGIFVIRRRKKAQINAS